KRGYVETIDDRLNKVFSGGWSKNAALCTFLPRRIEQVLTKYFEGADAPQSKNLNNKTERVVNGPEMGVYDAVNMSKNLEKIDVVALSESMNSLTVKNNTRYFTINDDADKNATPENTGDAMTEIKEMAEFLTSEPPLPEVYKGSRELPEEDLINHLVDKYRRHGFASKAPLIHIPTFLKQLRDKHNPPSIFLLNSLMAVSSFYTDDERVLKSGNPETAGEIFFERAIALNRDCSKWNISELEKAMRVRVFWSVMNAEIISCASFGKPLPVYDYNTPYPYPIEEDENPQEIVNYMHYSKLIHIYGNTLHSKPYFSHPASFRNTLPAVEAALRKWSLDLPQNLQFNLSAAGDPDPSTPFYTAFINQIYFAIIISLHRPYINSDQYPNIDSRKKCREAAINITKLSAYMNIKDRSYVYAKMSRLFRKICEEL
ncbi:13219_t:CDS:2, partial [Acaulospora colombiana]